MDFSCEVLHQGIVTTSFSKTHEKSDKLGCFCAQAFEWFSKNTKLKLSLKPTSEQSEGSTD